VRKLLSGYKAPPQTVETGGNQGKTTN